MKKLMVAIVSAASAIFAFGELPHGADFEANGYVVGESFTNYLNKADDGVSTTGDRYWESSGEEIGTIAEYTGTGRIGVEGVPDIYTNALTNANYLQLDSGKTRLLRNIASDGTAVSMSTGDGIYLDTLVKFSAASSLLDSDFESGDKLAIAYVGELDDGNYLSNFVVRAGVVGSDVTNYVANVPDLLPKFDVNEWYRLTIRTIADIGGGRAGFKIYIDGKPMVYLTDKDEFAQSAGFADDTHTIFPSALEAGQTNADTITAVAFAGNGSIDDVVFTTDTPNFIKETESVVATFTVDSGVTAITVQVGSAEPIVVDMNNLEAILPPGTTGFTVMATIDGDNDYTFAKMTYGGVDYNTNPATITGYAGGAIAITTTRNNFSLFDGNNDPITGTFQTLAEALAAQGVAKIQLANDYTVDEDDIPNGYIEILESVTIDLNGKTLDGGESISNPLFMVTDGNFVIIDSVGGGKVVYDGPGIVYGATAYIGAVSGDLGPTFDGQLFYENGEGNVIRGQFDYAGNTASGAEPAFLWDAFLGDGDSVESECTGLVSGYWAVEPKGGSEPTTYALTIPTVTGASATVTDKATSSVIADLTAIEDGTVVTVTWTADSGYKITAGATEEITMDDDKTADMPTVVAITYATLTITPVANCTIVVSNATEEVATGAKFDEDEAVQLTVYRTPAEGYELDNCAATETITMDQDQTVTAAVKQSGGDYPSYIDGEDTEAQGKYDTWKSYVEGASETVGDGEALEEAYLLNCKPSEVAAAKAAFKFTSISYDSTQSKWVTPTTTSYNNRDYNGEVVVKQYSDVGCTTESSTGTFFKAVLQ